MSTYNAPPTVSAGQLAKATDVNNLNSAAAAAFTLLPTNDQINRGKVCFGVDTGVANAYLLATPKPATSYSDGSAFVFRPLYNNTGASTINVDSLGAVSIKTGSNTTPSAGDIVAGVPIEVRYSSITGCVHLMRSAAGEVSAAAASAAALVSQSAAAVSAAAALVSQNASAVSAAAALVSKNAAEAAESGADADLVLTNADVVLTHADVVLTHADVVLTHADVVLTHADVDTTALDVIATAADRVQTGLDAIAAAADAVTAALQAAALIGTSTSSLAIAVASKTFTTQASKKFSAGMFVLAVSDANPANYMHGQVTSYSGTSLVVNVTNIGGSGTLADWTISVSGSRGATGMIPIASAAEIITGTEAAKAIAPDQLKAANIVPPGDTAYAASWDGVTGVAPSKNAVYDVIQARTPAGEVKMWPTETVPAGYLECNGASLDRTTYAELFAIISTLYGTASGTTFNLPDLRGRFPRFWDHAKALDPDRATRTAPTTAGATITAGDHVGTEQVDGFKSHTHTKAVDVATNANTGVSYVAATAYDVATGSTGGNETRPANVYLMPIIKY